MPRASQRKPRSCLLNSTAIAADHTTIAAKLGKEDTLNEAKPRTRIQEKNRALVLEAALEVFSRQGFRGATLDEIAREAGLSKPNLLYYFASKDEIHVTLLEGLVDTWLDPLRAMKADGDPQQELLGYMRRKLQMSRDYPRESRLFAQEIVQGAPRMIDGLSTDLRALVDEKADVIRAWMTQGRLASASFDNAVGLCRFRPPSPDLFDLGADPALRRFRRAGPGRSGPWTRPDR